MSFDRKWRRVEYLETVTSDAGGSQSLATATNTHHRFVYDGYLCIQRLDAAANNSIDMIFAWDPAETVATRLLMIEKPSACMMHVTHDGNKNVSDLVFFKNVSGVAAHYEFAPFGALTAATRNSVSTAYDFRTYNPFRFSCEYVDGWELDCEVCVEFAWKFGSFGLNIGSSRWLNWNSIVLPTGIQMTGMVLPDKDSAERGTVVSQKETTPCQDMVFDLKMARMLGSTALYSVGRHNCRMFAQLMFADAPGNIIK